ncbi:MAG: tRNA pseudouridine(55) synthase TruB [Zoogloeaceae bacterium]|jgi:tRNA pseudouridine55 synthase|nr:tRNA pseudouridine(55) synthase TruB [Zoogloeaceae bacterium]
MQVRRIKKKIDGVLLLDKPVGLSSNAALQKARHLFGAAKAGHTGTLDPFATGLLPVCFGEATKFSADLLHADKTYEATLQLGEETDTGDHEGEIGATADACPTLAEIEALLPEFLGAQTQIPPMHSALKHQGRPLYELARQGQTIERAPRSIHIHTLDVLDWQPAPRRLRLRVACSKGTYVRVLAADLGRALGCFAHLIALRRTRIAHLAVENALTLERLAEHDEAGRLACLSPVDALLAQLPVVRLESGLTERFLHGNPVETADMPTNSDIVKVYADTTFIGTGARKADGKLWPLRLLSA